MEIPFAGTVYGRRGRREAALDLIEAVENENIDSVSDVDLPAAEPVLLLQKMENKLVRHHLAAPDVLSDEKMRKLRFCCNRRGGKVIARLSPVPSPTRTRRRWPLR